MKQDTALKILKTGRNVFLTGAAGSGKTHTLNQYIDYLKRHRIPVAVTASTGIAATHIGGQTIHSWSGIGVKEYLDEYTLDGMAQKQPLVKRLNGVEVLIIDEVSMLGAHMLEMIDQVCRTLRRREEPFGGLQLVLSGDFFQLPPVSRDAMNNQFAYIAPSWQRADIRVCYLKEQHRQDDMTLSKILNEIRAGVVSREAEDALKKRVGAQSTIETDPTHLFSHNRDVDERNQEEFEKLSGNIETYTMSSSGRKNLVETLAKNILAPGILDLKVGTAVMFVKNDMNGRFVNGTRGTVVSFESGQPVVETLSGTRVYAEPMEWSVEEDGKVLASVTQVPLRHAWAITIHKSQGMSLDMAEIDLSKTFTPGQGYVALSRVRTLEGLVLRGLGRMALMIDERVQRFDVELRSQSEKWEKVIEGFSEEKIQEMHNEFITRTGGSLEEVEPEKPEPKISTHQKTYDLVKKGYTIKKIAKERGLTEGTILGHLEKLKDIYPDMDLSAFEPKKTDLKKIEAAFKKTKGVALSPVHKALGGKYSFEELRLARLFI